MRERARAGERKVMGARGTEGEGGGDSMTGVTARPPGRKNAFVRVINESLRGRDCMTVISDISRDTRARPRVCDPLLFNQI